MRNIVHSLLTQMFFSFTEKYQQQIKVYVIYTYNAIHIFR